MHYRRKEDILIVILVIISLLVLGNICYQNLYEKKDKIAIKTKESSKQSNEIIEKDFKLDKKGIVVHIGGEVVKPGVYKCEKKSRLYRVLKKAGGATEKADLDAVNLAFEIHDGEKIIIPSITDSNTKEEKKININQAKQKELEEISGVGAVTAQKIIDYRKREGRFRKLSNLTDVSGIGPKTLAKIKDEITY